MIQPYQKLSDDANAKFKKDYQTYLDSRTSEDIVLEEKKRAIKVQLSPEKKRARVARDPSKPKQPPNAYLLFLKDVRSGKEVPGLDRAKFLAAGSFVKEQVAMAARLWKTLPDDAKEVCYSNEY
jgi:hypothetical protein